MISRKINSGKMKHSRKTQKAKIPGIPEIPKI